MPISKNRKGHAKKAASHKQRIKDLDIKKQHMYEKFLKEIDKYNVSMTDMLNKEDKDKLPGGLDQTLGQFPVEATYRVVDMPEHDPNEPIIINEPFHIVGTPEEEADQKRIQASTVTTSHSGKVTVENLYSEPGSKFDKFAVTAEYNGVITQKDLDNAVKDVQLSMDGDPKSSI